MNAALINPFTNSGAHVPEAPESAAAIACPQPRAAAAPVSDGVGAKPILAFTPSEAATDPGREPVAAEPLICGVCGHNPITQALEIRPALPVSSEPNLVTPSVAAGIFPDEDEALYLLLKFFDKPATPDLSEIPDEHALMNEIEPMDPFLHFLLTKKSEPHLAGDPVWADEPPLFLKG